MRLSAKILRRGSSWKGPIQVRHYCRFYEMGLPLHCRVRFVEKIKSQVFFSLSYFFYFICFPLFCFVLFFDTLALPWKPNITAS
jgi:hypothetical protein